MQRSRTPLLLTVILFVAALGLAASAMADGRLFVGTDTEEFNGITPDRLGRFTTVGPTISGGGIIPLDFPLNGMGGGAGFLYAGDPLSNMLRTVAYDGTLLSAIPAGFAPCGLFEACKNEDLVFDGTNLYHAHWSPTTPPGNIQRIDPVTGAVLATYEQAEVIGMTMVGSEIWISLWAPRRIGKWDPATNTFTTVFGTPVNAGGLAYDPGSGVLWVGLQGGRVVPYDTTGAPLGPGFLPFGPIDDTIDGLEFVCAPTITGASASPSVLWPPNHRMVDVTLTYGTTSCSGPATCTLTVSSNEPVDGSGDGHTSPDWEVVDATHVRLRAERSGNGTGRTYTIVIVCTDGTGQTTTATVEVTVPHDQRP
jgi:hypothetical protein